MLKERKILNNAVVDGSNPGTVKRLSLRDPAGSLYELEGKLYRVLSQPTWEQFERIYSSFCVRKLMQEEKLISFRVLENKEQNEVTSQLKRFYSGTTFSVGKILEHKKIDFIVYPHEWCSEMLRQAGLLTLDIAERLLESGLGLKDASPFNVLYDFKKPLFIDVLSIEERRLDSALWMAYGQFCKTFSHTLLLSKHFNMSFEKSLATNRDGLPSERVYSLLNLRQKLTPPFLTSVTLPILLAKNHNPFRTGIYEPKKSSPEVATFTLQHLFRSLRRRLESLETNSATANKYMENDLPYSEEQFAEKTEIISETFKKIRPARVLDLGCNTGHFSFLAASSGAEVVAIDSDPTVVNSVFKSSRAKNLTVLPMHMDITCPTPASGWESEETRSFMSRASGSFDTVLMLALIHHLQTTHSIPLEAIASLAAKLTNKWLVVEYISPEDPVFASLAHGRDYSHVTNVYFEKIFGTLFTVEQKTIQKNRFRTLYLLKKTSSHVG